MVAVAVATRVLRKTINNFKCVLFYNLKCVLFNNFKVQKLLGGRERRVTAIPSSFTHSNRSTSVRVRVRVVARIQLCPRPQPCCPPRVLKHDTSYA